MQKRTPQDGSGGIGVTPYSVSQTRKAPVDRASVIEDKRSGRGRLDYEMQEEGKGAEGRDPMVVSWAGCSGGSTGLLF